jgi:hypothetical protein
VREHPPDAKAGESQADQGARPLGGVALVPRGPAQPVAEVDVGDVAAGPGAKMEPAKRFSGGGGLGRPGAESVEPFVDAKMKGDDPDPDLLLGALACRRCCSAAPRGRCSG